MVSALYSWRITPIACLKLICFDVMTAFPVSRRLALLFWSVGVVALLGYLQSSDLQSWGSSTTDQPDRLVASSGLQTDWTEANWFTALTKLSDLPKTDQSEHSSFPTANPRLVATVAPGIVSTRYVLSASAPNIDSPLADAGKYVSEIDFVVPGVARLDDESSPCEYQLSGSPNFVNRGSEKSTSAQSLKMLPSAYGLSYRIVRCRVTPLTNELNVGTDDLPNQVTLRYSVLHGPLPIDKISFVQTVAPASIYGILGATSMDKDAHVWEEYGGQTIVKAAQPVAGAVLTGINNTMAAGSAGSTGLGPNDTRIGSVTISWQFGWLASSVAAFRDLTLLAIGALFASLRPKLLTRRRVLLSMIPAAILVALIPMGADIAVALVAMVTTFLALWLVTRPKSESELRDGLQSARAGILPPQL